MINKIFLSVLVVLVLVFGFFAFADSQSDIISETVYDKPVCDNNNRSCYKKEVYVKEIPNVNDGSEIKYHGHKVSNNDNVFGLIPSFVSCEIKPDHIDDGFKKCVAGGYVEDNNFIKDVVENVSYKVDFESNQSIRNLTIFTSYDYDTITTFENDSSTNISYKREVKSFKNFVPSFSQIDSSKPLGYLINYDDAKHNSNNWNLSIIGTRKVTKSQFKAFNDPAQNGCGDLYTANSVYTLEQNTNSTNNCFNFNNHGIVLNCNYLNVTYGISGVAGTNGFNNTGGFDNITVQNCLIFEGNSSGSQKAVIHFSNSINSTIRDVNFTTRAQDSSGIVLDTSSHNFTITNISGSVSGSGANCVDTRSSNDGVVNFSSCISNGFGYGYFSLTGDRVILRNNTLSTLSISTSVGSIGLQNFNLGLLDSNILTGNTACIVLSGSANAVNRTLFLNNDMNCVGEEIRDSYSASLALDNNIKYNNSYGEFFWTNKSFLSNMSFNSISGIALGRNLFINNGSLGINTSAFTYGRINSSANMTLFGLNFTRNVTAVFKVPYYDVSNSQNITNSPLASNCDGGFCQIYSYNGANGMLKFNSTGFSSFSANGTYLYGPNITWYSLLNGTRLETGFNSSCGETLNMNFSVTDPNEPVGSMSCIFSLQKDNGEYEINNRSVSCSPLLPVIVGSCDNITSYKVLNFWANNSFNVMNYTNINFSIHQRDVHDGGIGQGSGGGASSSSTGFLGTNNTVNVTQSIINNEISPIVISPWYDALIEKLSGFYNKLFNYETLDFSKYREGAKIVNIPIIVIALLLVVIIYFIVYVVMLLFREHLPSWGRVLISLSLSLVTVFLWVLGT